MSSWLVHWQHAHRGRAVDKHGYFDGACRANPAHQPPEPCVLSCRLRDDVMDDARTALDDVPSEEAHAMSYGQAMDQVSVGLGRRRILPLLESRSCSMLHARIWF